MKFRNSIKSFKNCQMYDWAQSDYFENNDDGENVKRFEIRGYGITDNNNSICVHVKGFEPYFYIEVPLNWNKSICKLFETQLKMKLGKKKDGLKQCKFINSKKLYGFTDYKKFNFIKIKSYNLSTFYECRRIVEGRYPYGVKKKSNEPELHGDRLFIIKRKSYDFSEKLYESNITPMLRFFHIRDLQPNGWMAINKHTMSDKIQTRCQLEIDCYYKDIEKVDKNEIAPLIIASFDIECTSSDGSFPDARRPGDEVIQIGTTFHRYGEKSCFYKNIITLKKCNKIEGVDVISCSNEKDVIIKWAELIRQADPDIITGYNIWGFDMSYIDRRCVNGCGERYESFSKQFYEIYSRNSVHKLKPKTSTLQTDFNDHISKIYKLLKKENNKKLHKLYEICIEELKAIFYSDFKKKQIINMIYRSNERIKNKIKKIDSDILKSNIVNEIDNICNKIKMLCVEKSEKSALSFKKLESSGLGQNFLKFWDVEGMVSIDMYKVVQSGRDNFVSYKLDYVSQQYIRGKIKNIIFEDNLKLIADNVDGLTVGQHLSLSIVSDHIDKQYLKTKFEIINIEDKCFTIKGIDITKLFTDETELEKFKENELSVEWYQNKIDLSPQQLFKNYRNGAADKITEIAVYCVKDCELVNFLIMKLETIANNVGEGNVCSVPMSYLFLRGQGAKIYSCFAKECRERGLLIKVLKRFDEQSKEEYKYLYKYDGAIVFPPEPGMYFDPVAVMDYASLYPSSMIAENISHDTLVKVIKKDKDGNLIKPVKEYEFYYGSDKYLGLEDYNYNEITFNNYDKMGEIDGEVTCIFAEKKDGTKGLVPALLDKLLLARRKTRASIKYKIVTTKDGTELSGVLKIKDGKYIITKYKEDSIIIDSDQVVDIKDKNTPFQKAVLDGLQQGYKLVCNSVYGQVGAMTGQFTLVQLAAATTATGREMLEIARDKTLEQYKGSKLVYGDSIVEDEPLLLQKEDGTITIKTIETISNEWKSYEEFKPFDTNRKEKQQSITKYKVWANNKWNIIKRVIRHKTNKSIYRVNTHCGVVDVTEDHSLLNENSEKLKPNECIINETKLLQSFPVFTDKSIKLNEIIDILDKYETYNRSFEEKKAFVYGMFYGDGSCGMYNCLSGKKYSWALNNQNKKILNMCKNYLSEVYNFNDFEILETMKSSSVYKLVPKGSIKKMVNIFRPVFYDEIKYKIVPDKILNADYNIRLQFFLGYYAADGAKARNSKTKNIRFDNKGKIGSAQLYYLVKSLGYKASIRIRKDKLNIYRISCCAIQRKPSNILKKMIKLRESNDEEFVYDLETVDGQFQAGVGEIIVKNTDSVFINFKDYLVKKHGELTNKDLLQKTIEVGQEAGHYVNTFLKQPQDLEYEKTFYPFVIFSKKRYFGNKYEYDNVKYKQTSMGIVLKRRDNAPIVKRIYKGVIDILLNKRNLNAAITYYKIAIRNLLQGQIHIDELVITKSLKSSDSYSNPTQIAHRVLADRMGERDPGNKPQANDRVPYCYIDSRSIRCFVCNRKVNKQNCKCLKCMKPFCIEHLKNHRDVCKTICRYYKQTVDDDPSIKQCSTCKGWYSKKAMGRHHMRKDKYGKIHHDKCKKPLTTKLLQGDIIENPDYILKKKIKLDYRYYLEHQIQNPVMQIFELRMKNPTKITEDLLREDTNKKSGQQSITKWFNI